MTLTSFDYCMSVALKVVAQSTVTISTSRLTAASGLASSVSHWLYSLDGVAAEVAIFTQRITEVW